MYTFLHLATVYTLVLIKEHGFEILLENSKSLNVIYTANSGDKKMTKWFINRAWKLKRNYKEKKQMEFKNMIKGNLLLLYPMNEVLLKSSVITVTQLLNTVTKTHDRDQYFFNSKNTLTCIYRWFPA